MTLPAQLQYIQNKALKQNYEALLRAMDCRRKRYYETQYACCDAYHLSRQPESIRCCVLGQGYGI